MNRCFILSFNIRLNHLKNLSHFKIMPHIINRKAEQKKSYEIIYSQHMWLCTSPAYDTVHMRSIAIDIRLHKNSGLPLLL